MTNIDRLRQLAGIPLKESAIVTESVKLTSNTKFVTLANGDWVELSFNPAGKNGYLDDVWYTWVEHDYMMSWDVNGKSLDGDPEYDIVSIDK